MQPSPHERQQPRSSEHRRRRHRRLVQHALRAPVVPADRAREQPEGAGGRRQHARAPDRDARAARSSTATARCSRRTGASWAVTVDREPRRRRTATRVLGQLAEQLGVPVKELESQYDEPAPVAARAGGRRARRAARRSGSRSSQDPRGLSRRARDGADGPHVPARRPRGAGARLRRRDRQPTSSRSSKQRGYQAGDQIGRAGVEAAFESVLRGKPRTRDGRGRSDRAAGRRAGHGRVPGSVGDNVNLTIDIEGAARGREGARAKGSLSARTLQNAQRQGPATRRLKAPAGAVVVLDARQRLGRRRWRAIPTYPLDVVGRRHQHARTSTSLTNPASDNPLLEPGDRRASTRRARRSSS